MDQIRDLIGREHGLEEVVWALRRFAQDLGAPVVGGHQVTCSDEAEWESAETFQRLFAQELFPPLKPGRQIPFRSVNLGARYEWGAIRVAEDHFATPESRDQFKLLVLKINSHVGVCTSEQGIQYGSISRYGSASDCCGAISGLLHGAALPAIEELRRLFRTGGVDRLAMLRDPRDIPAAHQILVAAIVNASLQAQRAVADIVEYHPETPTIFLVLPCVSINRPGPDTELVVGQYGVDWTEAKPTVKYSGLGDDPSQYRIEHKQQRLVVTDDQWPA